MQATGAAAMLGSTNDDCCTLLYVIPLPMSDLDAPDIVMGRPSGNIALTLTRPPPPGPCTP
eukprot:COSAG05_NODE_1198_length_5555_cov_3.672287_11_plen_61_part_00